MKPPAIHGWNHLPEILEGIHWNCEKTSIDPDVLHKVTLTADSGFHNEKNMELIYNRNIQACIADNQFRRRDVRFSDAGKYKKRITAWEPSRGKKYFTPEDFQYSPEAGTLICPAGKSLWLKTKNFQTDGGLYRGKSYMGHVRDCQSCELRKKCLRKETTKARQVTMFTRCGAAQKINYTALMQDHFDSVKSRKIYSKRMGTVEPVFGHIASVKWLNRFTLRTKQKVTIQWTSHGWLGNKNIKNCHEQFIYFKKSGRFFEMGAQYRETADIW